MRRRRRITLIALAGAAGAMLLGASGCATWRLGEARVLARSSQPLQQQPSRPALRMVVAGDSTAVGTGASAPQSSLAGLIAQDFPRLAIDNRARDGATLADTAAQIERTPPTERFDLLLVMAGGNDVIRLRSEAALRADIDRVLTLARQRADHVVLMPAGNVGNAPFFPPPVAWAMTRRARMLHAVVAELAPQRGAAYVNLFRERDDDPFVRERGLHAADGLHPSDAGYRAWYEALLAQTDLRQRLAAAR